MSEIDEVVSEFLVESHENLDRLDRDLLALEQDPENAEALGSVFRTVHTIKGTCGFLGFATLESVTHVAETLLGRLRDGDLTVDTEIASALLATGDAIRGMLAQVEATGTDGASDHSDLVAALARLGGQDATTGTLPQAQQAPAEAPQEAPSKRLGEILVDRGAAESYDVIIAAHEQQLGDTRKLGEILVDQGAAGAADVVEALEAQGSHGSGVADTSIRVDVDVLDGLMTLVGELVLARNQIAQLATSQEPADLDGASQRLSLITGELQERVMKTRMQPIGSVWSRLPRVVRDLAQSCGKQVRLELEGEETELDKTVIEAIKDPLTHLVRNAVDHGIEDPDARVAAGKPEHGRLRMRAFHEGGQVNIEIADDGRGLDLDRVRDKAVEQGLVTAAQAARMGEREVAGLIFAPGFSTARQVTNVSGRGVGMDVVKTNIERIGGAVDVLSRPGAGTTFKVKIPLTLAIIPALVVTSGGDQYAIPQVSLVELVRLEGERARSGIESLHGVPVYRLRERLLPIVHLARELDMPADGGQPDVVNIVVLRADGRQFGLVVDRITDTQEIVVKPLGKQVGNTGVFAGATIMGDGRVALILDVLGLAHQSGVVGGAGERPLMEQEDEEMPDEDANETMLLVGLPGDRRAAIGLPEIARLEEFPPSAVERTSHEEVVQYRGRVLPLIRLAEVLGIDAVPADPHEPLHVVVHAHQGRTVGVVVGRIIDIVSEPVAGGGGVGPVIGTAVIAGRATEVLDIAALIQAAAGPRAHTGA